MSHVLLSPGPHGFPLWSGIFLASARPSSLPWRDRRPMPAAPVAASRRLPMLPFVQCRHGPPELVIRRQHPGVPVPVLPRWRDQIREPVEELKQGEFDDAIGPWPRGLPPASRADPVGGLVSREYVADAGDAAV